MTFTLDYILRTVDWMDFCKVTGTSEWAMAEGQISRDDTISLTEEQSTKLGLLINNLG